MKKEMFIIAEQIHKDRLDLSQAGVAAGKTSL